MDTEQNVAGTHRPHRPTVVYLWAACSVIWLALAALNLAQSHGWMTVFYGVFALMYVLLAWATTRAHTDVGADGLRVSNGLGGKQVDWDAIEAVGGTAAGLWLARSTVTVETRAGKTVATHVPTEHRADFVAYANAHRSTASRTLV